MWSNLEWEYEDELLKLGKKAVTSFVAIRVLQQRKHLDLCLADTQMAFSVSVRELQLPPRRTKMLLSLESKIMVAKFGSW
jgi:hypothetical protein